MADDYYTGVSGARILAGAFGFSLSNLTYSWPPGAPCSIPAVAGVSAPIHCKVLDLANVGGFGGYRYWMAFTPYPLSGDDTAENPSVVASNDGDTWLAPTTNPVVAMPTGAATGYLYNADTHLHLDGGVLRLFWITNESTGFYAGTRTTTIWMKESLDGVLWGAQQQILQTVTTDSVPLLSPCIERVGLDWWLWTYDSATNPITCRLRKAQALSGPWGAPQTCTLALPDPAREIWHFDVTRHGGEWWMLIADREVGSRTKGWLWLASSADGVVWSVGSSPISSGSPNVYRSSIATAGSGLDAWVTDWDARTIRRMSLR